MPLPALQFALRAKQQEIESLRSLADRIELTDLLGRLIHAIQRERGASSIYLASSGERFIAERRAARDDAKPLADQLRERLDQQLLPERGSNSRVLSQIAWVLIDLESLDTLRVRIDGQAVSAPDSVMAFSKVIGGLMELIFQLADGALDPSVSRMLVALVHVAQGKEEAGQERAVGAHMFAAGRFSADQQQRLLHLIGAQERSLEVFAQFADAAQCRWWQERALAPHVTVLEKLRRILCTARAGDTLDASLSESWFQVCSDRITDLWHLQIALTMHVRQACDAQIDVAGQAVRDSEELMRRWRSNPPPHTLALDHFFAGDADSETPASPIPEALSHADRLTVASLKTLLQTQSARLARAEVELDEVRRTLHERKVVQRAKTVLMTRHGMSEATAFRLLQKASMDRNQPIVEVSEAVLLSPESLSARMSAQTDEPLRVSKPRGRHRT